MRWLRRLGLLVCICHDRSLPLYISSAILSIVVVYSLGWGSLLRLLSHKIFLHGIGHFRGQLLLLMRMGMAMLLMTLNPLLWTIFNLLGLNSILISAHLRGEEGLFPLRILSACRTNILVNIWLRRHDPRYWSDLGLRVVVWIYQVLEYPWLACFYGSWRDGLHQLGMGLDVRGRMGLVDLVYIMAEGVFLYLVLSRLRSWRRFCPSNSATVLLKRFTVNLKVAGWWSDVGFESTAILRGHDVVLLSLNILILYVQMGWRIVHPLRTNGDINLWFVFFLLMNFTWLRTLSLPKMHVLTSFGLSGSIISLTFQRI